MVLEHFVCLQLGMVTMVKASKLLLQSNFVFTKAPESMIASRKILCFSWVIAFRNTALNMSPKS